MLNYETLLSSYDDKLTLLQWLKKVEAALNDASAVSFNVNKTGDATLTFSIVFEDGSEIESGEIVLQQGESVESAAIVNGHLILTLTNGDELDAGDILNGNINITGTLTCAGDVLINADLTAGEIVGSKVSSTGLLTASGNATFTSDISVGGAATITGDLSADEISGNSIVENMTGYSLTQPTQTKGTLTYLYASAVKNGNKLTFVNAYTFNRNVGATGSITTARFVMPEEVAAKIYPFTGSIVSSTLIEATTNGYSGVSVRSIVTKYDNRSVYFEIALIDGLTEGTDYYIRQELTILLSDNMAA